MFIIYTLNLFTELPWDEPTTGCAEFVKWKSDISWMTITPWSKLETLALSLLRKILEPDSRKRITVQGIIEHKWCRVRLSGTCYTFVMNYSVMLDATLFHRDEES